MSPTLREQREAAGLSQFELATRTGIDPGRLSKMERGLARPTLEQAVALERELGIPVESWVETSSSVEPVAAGAEG